MLPLSFFQAGYCGVLCPGYFRAVNASNDYLMVGKAALQSLATRICLQILVGHFKCEMRQERSSAFNRGRRMLASSIHKYSAGTEAIGHCGERLLARPPKQDGEHGLIAKPETKAL